MITLVTPHPESIFDPDGLDQAFHRLSSDMRELAERIGRSSDHRVLVISSSGKEVAPKSLRCKEDMPVTVARIPRQSCPKPDDPMAAALAATYNIGIAVQSFCCCLAERQKHLVFVDNADYYFYPSKELGTFTERLDSDARLVEQINAIGECLAGYDGHLILAAALSQYRERLLRFLDGHGWSWVRDQAGRLELEFGTLPGVLEDYCEPKREPEPLVEWSKPMTVQQLAKRFDCHRNTMSKRLREGVIPSRKVGSLYQVPVSDLPKK